MTRLEQGMSQTEKKESILTPEEMKSIEFLAARMNTEIDGTTSVGFWPFNIFMKISEELMRLDAEIVSIKHHRVNDREEFIRVCARIDKLEADNG